MVIYVGSLPFKIKEGELKLLFEHYGDVSSVTIIKDKITRQNKGFGFVEMPNEEEALKAIEHLNNFGISERKLIVSRSEPKDLTQDRFLRGNNPKRSGEFNRASSPKSSSSQGGFGKDGFSKGGFGKGPQAKGGFKKPGGPKKRPQ
jgi:RNA recognition motif-containing protein